MRVILQVFYTLFSSLLLSLAIPNELITYGSPFIAFTAMIPYYLVFRKCRSFREAIGLGFLQTFTTHLLSSYWLAFFKDFAALTLGASALGTGLWGGFFGLFFYLPYYTEKRRNTLNLSSMTRFNVPVYRIFWFAAVYTAYEWFKSSGFLGYPWGTISSCMFKARLFMQLSAITGTYGITFLTVFFSAMVAEGASLFFTGRNRPNFKNLVFSYRNCVRFWVILFGLSMIYGAVQYTLPRTPVKKITTVMVQQNEDPWISGTDRHTILLSEELTQKQLDQLEKDGKKADLIVWSEGVLKSVYPDSKSHYENFPYENPLTRFIRKNKTPLLTGGSYIQRYENHDNEYYNAAHVFDKNGEYRGYYGKNHLVPFAEAIPFSEIPKIRELMEKFIGISAGWTPGKQYVFFEIPCQWYDKPVLPAVKNISLLQDINDQRIEENLPPTVKISTPICFDDSFTDIMRPLWKNGSEVFMNITDDSWSLKASSEIQHFVIASYRSIEYRTTLVRSTNAGLSCVLDPAGKVLKQLPLFESCAMTCDIPVYKRKTTTYARFGNWLPFILIVFILFQWVLEMRFFKKREYVFPETEISLEKKKRTRKSPAKKPASTEKRKTVSRKPAEKPLSPKEKRETPGNSIQARKPYRLLKRRSGR